MLITPSCSLHQDYTRGCHVRCGVCFVSVRWTTAYCRWVLPLPAAGCYLSFARVMLRRGLHGPRLIKSHAPCERAK